MIIVIILPARLESIGDGAFEDCSSLERVEIPDGVTSVGNNTFSGCTSLIDIKLPDSLVSIGDGAFKGCIMIIVIILPAKLENIGSSAFENCSSLEKVEIPGTVDSLGDNAFQGCSGLSDVKFSSGVKYIGDGAFGNCTNLININLPDTLLEIGNSAFYNCILIIVITIPESVLSIGDGILDGCISLKTIYVEGDIAPEGLEEAINSALKDIEGEIDVDLGVEKGHRFGQWIVEYDGGCYTNGSRYHDCMECGQRFYEEIPRLPHTEEVIPGYEATLTEPGYTNGLKCTVCGTIIIAQQVIHPLGGWDGEIAESFAGGSGTIDDPFLISNAEEFARFAYLINHGKENSYFYYNKSYKLISDINLGGKEWTPIGCYYSQTYDNDVFRGTFDGNGYVVRNFTVTDSNNDYKYMYGLFEFVYGGTIMNLGVEDFVITIENHRRDFLCVGGLVGNVNSTQIVNCYTKGTIIISTSHSSKVGGIVGYPHSSSSINNCFSACDISASGNSILVGGLVGDLSCNVYNSFSASKVSLSSTQKHVGALIGGMSGNVRDCYAIGGEYIRYNGNVASHNNFGIIATIDEANLTEFYKSALGWSSEIWDFNNVDIANGILPKLRKGLS